LAEQFSQTTGIPVKTVIMTQVLGFSTTILPYQTPPILIAMSLAGEKLSKAVKFCGVLALLTVIFLMPVNFLWWKILGWL